MRMVIAALLALWVSGVHAAERFIVVASTTSTDQSGLFGYILPRFTAASGIEVRIVALGTGQALQAGMRGDADVVLVHDRDQELKLVAEGHFVERRDVMYNDFVIVGPKADPAKVKGSLDATEAFQRIAAAKAAFVSRGDRSGTHAAELRLWKDAGIDLDRVRGAWYRDSGSGMGPALNVAAAMDGYILADRGTWLSFGNRRALEISVEGDRRLFNQYGVMLVNPERRPHVKAEDGRRFIAWLVSPDGQRAIAEYRIGGEGLFFANARPEGS